MDASYVDLADPSHLEFDYMRWIRIVLRTARARRVVHVGGGACALARALAAEDPGGRQQVCEVDRRGARARPRASGAAANPGAAGTRGRGTEVSRGSGRVELGCGGDRRIRRRGGSAPADHGRSARRRRARRAARAGQRRRRPLGPRRPYDRGGAVGVLSQRLGARRARRQHDPRGRDGETGPRADRGSRRRRPLPRAAHDTGGDGDCARRPRARCTTRRSRRPDVRRRLPCTRSKPNAVRFTREWAAPGRRCSCSTGIPRPT